MLQRMSCTILIFIVAWTCTEAGGPTKQFKCPSKQVDVGCKCIDPKSAKTLQASLKQYKYWLTTAGGGHYESLKRYGKAWSTYEVYMRIAAHCKVMSARSKRAYIFQKRLRRRSGARLRLCRSLSKKLKRSKRYKARIKARITNLMNRMKTADKIFTNMDKEIIRIQDYINDSCRYMMQVYTFRKSVAWATKLHFRHRVNVLNRLYKPLLRTLKNQQKEYTAICNKNQLKKTKRNYHSSKWKMFKFHRLYNRFRRCKNHAKFFATYQVQNRMLKLKIDTQRRKELELKYLKKKLAVEFRLCVLSSGFNKCKDMIPLFKKLDVTKKKWSKIAPKLKEEMPEKIMVFEKRLSKHWKNMKLTKLQKKLQKKYG